MTSAVRKRLSICGRLALATSFMVAAASFDLSGQAPRPSPREWSSGGRLIPEQAAYDVFFYDLALRVSPSDSTIDGALTAYVTVTRPLSQFVLDLDTVFAVHSVTDLSGGGKHPLPVERRGGRIWMRLLAPLRPGAELVVRVEYGGRPRIALRPPWIGGFQWARTADGSPWIATTCVNEGADIWWPVKDHPSDKPDSVSLHFTVPRGLVVASNGQPRGQRENADSTTTFNWTVTTPISNYEVALNVAPYRVLGRTYTSTSGYAIPVTYFVLPENVEKGERLLDEIVAHLSFFEHLLGPYPFRADKYGVVETPHLGMEHQTIIAYGNGYRLNPEGYDELHQHELSHEWFGNLITARDWSDYWLHEGFGSYMQPLYAEKLGGKAAYRTVIARLRAGIKNKYPVAPRGPLTAGEVYFEPPDYLNSTGDMYGKGAVVLHTLRGLLGDRLFFQLLRRWLYPTPDWERLTDGSQVRLVDTDQFVHLAEQMAKRKLGWFFTVYVRQPALPKLVVSRGAGQVSLRWETPGRLPFPMPIEVEVAGQRRRVEMPNGHATIRVRPDAAVTIDPDRWVLRDEKGG
ncbi:MAG: M1 family metallopeptidase [Gemmatimonadota bacterium]